MNKKIPFVISLIFVTSSCGGGSFSSSESSGTVSESDLTSVPSSETSNTSYSSAESLESSSVESSIESSSSIEPSSSVISEESLETSQPQSSSNREEEVPLFVEKNLDAFVRSPMRNEKITLYYRQDALEGIPYVKLSTYYHFLLDKELSVETKGIGLYEVTSAAKGVAIIDTISDTIFSEDLERFISTTIFRQEGVTNTYYDGSPFLRIKEVVNETEVVPSLLDYASYGIDIFGVEDDILLPLVTASNLFQGPTMLTCLYTAKKVYFIDPNDLNYDTSYVYNSAEYKADCLGFFENGIRSEEQAEFSYNNLCFLIDHYHGRPGREALHDSLLEYGNLDKAMQNHDEFTEIARDLLVSTHFDEYAAGMTILNDYLFDAGHSYVGEGVRMAASGAGQTSSVNAILRKYGYISGMSATKTNYDNAYVRSVYSLRSSNGITDKAYKRTGDTLLYTFDSFIFDIEEWNRYFAGRDEMPKDALGQFKRTLDEFKGDTTLKNIVLDITFNRGGFGDLVFTFMGMMGEEAYIRYNDMVNHNTVTTYYEIDRNLDGKFDEQDAETTYPYHFGILSSAISFSCGNLLPAQADDAGLALLGDKSGGGCCAVLDCVTAEGLYSRLSSQIHITALNGESVDFGVEPDYYLVLRDNGNVDLSNLFNLSKISECMNEHFDS